MADDIILNLHSNNEQISHIKSQVKIVYSILNCYTINVQSYHTSILVLLRAIFLLL
jgi:hypothetical protein